MSWLRHLHPVPQLIALNNMSNSPDKRVEAIHTPGSQKFVLKLRTTRLEDSGVYECQVAGKGKIPLFKLIVLDVVGTDGSTNLSLSLLD